MQQDAVWTAPLLWRSEFRNALIGLSARIRFNLKMRSRLSMRPNGG